MGTALLEHPQCVHCGFCLPECPTYSVLGTEMDNPRGRLFLMDALAAGRIDATPAVVRHLDLCLGCRACESACPSGVHYGEQLEATREQLSRASGRPWGQRLTQRMMLASVAAGPGWQRVLVGLAGLVRALGIPRLSGARLGRALLPRRMNTALALLAGTPRRRQRALPRVTAPSSARPGPPLRVALLTGCIARWLYPQVNAATVRLLSEAGCEVLIPAGQGCCGALHAHSGDRSGARALARRNLAAFEAAGPLDAVVVNAAGCGSAMKECDRLLADDPVWAGRAAAFAARTRDALELLAELDARAPLPLERRVEARVAYHDACHLAHAQRVRSGPRALLARIPGLELVPLTDADRCCGSAGIYNLLHPRVSSAILAPKLAQLAACGADHVAAANAGCLAQLSAGALQRGLSLSATHPLELLDRALPLVGSASS